jgi:hypothetical protein
MVTRPRSDGILTASTPMTIRVPLETRQKLERLAADTRRSKSFLAAEAVAAYLDHEPGIIDACSIRPNGGRFWRALGDHGSLLDYHDQELGNGSPQADGELHRTGLRLCA